MVRTMISALCNGPVPRSAFALTGKIIIDAQIRLNFSRRVASLVAHQAAGVDSLQQSSSNEDDRFAGERLVQSQHSPTGVHPLSQLLLHLRY